MGSSMPPEPLSGPDDHRGREGLESVVQQLHRDFSVELTPREMIGSATAISEVLPPKTRVYITYLPASDFRHTVSATAAAAKAGLQPVPHIATRSIASMEAAESIIGRLAEAGAQEALVIGGSQSPPKGSLTNSLQILRSGYLEREGFRRIGVAGHPEGNKDIGDIGLADAIAEKNQFATESDIDIYLVTQFAFDPVPIVRWERDLRQAGNRMPVYVGLPGLASPLKLLKFGLSCGVGASLKVLKKQTGGIRKMATSSIYRPDPTVLGLAEAVLDDPESLLSGVHYFLFGTLERSGQWASDIRRGDFGISVGQINVENRP